MGRTHSVSKRADFFCRARLFEDAVLEVRVRLEDLRAVFLRVVDALREDVFVLLLVFFEVRFFTEFVTNLYKQVSLAHLKILVYFQERIDSRCYHQ